MLEECNSNSMTNELDLGYNILQKYIQIWVKPLSSYFVIGNTKYKLKKFDSKILPTDENLYKKSKLYARR